MLNKWQIITWIYDDPIQWFIYWSSVPVSISKKTSYHKISWSLEVVRLIVWFIESLWILTSTSAALLPICLSNFRAIMQFYIQISQLKDFARSYNKMSYQILKQGPDLCQWITTALTNALWLLEKYNIFAAMIICKQLIFFIQRILHWKCCSLLFLYSKIYDIVA